MTLRQDAMLIRKALKPEWKHVNEALDRIEATLPKPTVWEQFQAFPVGNQFTMGDMTFRFIKTGDTAAVRVRDSDGVADYFPNVLDESAFDYWATEKYELRVL